jgi:hypothetical protein
MATSLPKGGYDLICAAQKTRWKRSGVLADAGADLNLTDPRGRPSIVAVINAHFDLAGMLLERARIQTSPT